VIAVLQALSNASVVTDPANLQIVNNGGRRTFRRWWLVNGLGKISRSRSATKATLSSGVRLLSKALGAFRLGRWFRLCSAANPADRHLVG
jgi:hypothetical protein